MTDRAYEDEMADFASLMVDETIAALRVQLADGKGLVVADQLAVVDQLIRERKRLSQATPTLATVAAANDEAFARGVEAAAKVAENLCADMTVEANEESVGLTSALHRASAQTAGKIADAIRVLSQGGVK